MDLAKLYSELDKAIETQTLVVLTKAKNESLEQIRYHVGALNGLQIAKAAIHNIIVKGGE